MEWVSFDVLRGKKVVVDGTNYLVKYLSKMTHWNRDDRNPVSHLVGLFYLAINLLERKLRPVFVFDGMPMEEKRKVPSYKIMKLIYLWKKYSDGVHYKDETRKEVALQDPSFVFEKVIVEAMEFVKLLGLPVIRAPSEGEAQACKLVRDRLAHAVVSQDYDVLLFGSLNMIKELDFEKNTLLLVRLKDNLKNLGISHPQLVDLALLIGTDLNKGGVKGIGPKKALKMILEHGNLETINEKVIPLEFNFKKLRAKFLNPPTIEFIPIFRYPNLQVLKSYLRGKMPQERIIKGLSRLKNGFDFFKLRQQRIEAFL
jgi:flap endonuclease-1